MNKKETQDTLGTAWDNSTEVTTLITDGSINITNITGSPGLSFNTSAAMQVVTAASISNTPVSPAAFSGNIDGVAPGGGQLFLLIAQTDPTQNGLYKFYGSFLSLTGIQPPLYYVTGGNTNAGKLFVQNGTAYIPFSQNSTSPIKSVLSGYVTVAYSGTNVGAGDHIQFNGIYASVTRNTDIVLDTSSPYSTGTNTASIGRISLPAGKTFRITGSLNNVTNAGANNEVIFAWYNSDTNKIIGDNVVVVGIGTTAIYSAPGVMNIQYITTTVTTRIELRLGTPVGTVRAGANSSPSGGGGGVWFLIEEV